MFQSFSTYGSWISAHFYYVYPAVKCRFVPTVAKFPDDLLNISNRLHALSMSDECSSVAVYHQLGCVHIEIYGIRYMVFAIRYSVFAIRYTGTAVHIEVARSVSVLFS